MTDVSVEQVPGARASVHARLAALPFAVVAVLVITALYVRVGWWRMESACSLDSAHGSVHNSVSYDWSWQPLGFRCTYDNGQTQSSLWF